MKLTDFNTVVDTYKKNFLIRKKRFKDLKTQESVEKRKKRENRIEIGKFAKRVGGGFANKFKSSKGDFLNNLLRFAAFAVLGLIVANIEKIILALKNLVEKIKEVVENLKTFYEEKLKPFFEDVYNTAKGLYKAFKNLLDFSIDVNPLNDLSDLLDTVMLGMLGMGYKMGSLNAPKAPTKPPTPPAKAGKTPVKTPAKTPVKTKVKPVVRQPSTRPVKTFAKKPLVTAPTGTGTGKGTGTGVPTKTTSSGMLSDSLKDILKKSSDVSLKNAAAEYLRMKGSEPFSKDLTSDLTKNIDAASRANFERFVKALEDEKLKADAKFRKQLGLDTPEGAAAAQQAAMDIKSDLDKGKPLKSGASVLDDLFEISKPKFSAKDIFKKLDSQIKYLTKGLDFRVDLKTPIMNAIKNPLQTLRTTGKGLVVGFAIESIANGIGKLISDNLPYDPKFKALGYFGLISKERIAKVAAQEILDRDEADQKIAIERLIKASESTPGFYDISGQQKKESAQRILNAIIKIRTTKEKTTKEQLEENSKLIDEALRTRVSLPAEVLSSTIALGANVSSGNQLDLSPNPSPVASTKITPTASVNRLAQGLNQETTYSYQGMTTVKETLIAIQPVEVMA